MPSVDIIVRAKDGEAMTARLMESIARNTPRDLYRLILVDDGSTNRCGDFGQDLTIRHESNRGAVSATNSGLAIALTFTDSEYVLILDNDAEVPAGDGDWLNRFIAEIEQAGPRTAAAGATSACANPPQHILQVPQTYTADWKDDGDGRSGKKQNLAVPVFVSFAVLIRKSAIRTVGFWDERYNPGNFEDTDYSVQLRRSGWEIIVARSVYLHHRGHATFGADLNPLLAKNMQQFVDKWGVGALADMGMVPSIVAAKWFQGRARAGEGANR